MTALTPRCWPPNCALSEGDVKPFSYGLLVEGDSARIRPRARDPQTLGQPSKINFEHHRNAARAPIQKKKVALAFLKVVRGPGHSANNGPPEGLEHNII